MSVTDVVQKSGRPPTRPSAGVSRPMLGLQCVSACAGTTLGSIVGSGTIGKLLASAGGAVIAAFLTAPGRHHPRRIVAVGLLLALLDEGKALAAGARHPHAQRVRRARRTRASTLPRPASLLVSAGAAAVGFGAGWAVVASPLVASSASPEGPVATLVASRSHPAAHHTSSSVAIVTHSSRRERLVSSIPGAGTRAAKASTVRLLVSTGAPVTTTVTIPDVSGDAQSTAARILRAAGFVTAVFTQASATVPVGHVIATAPRAGQAAHKGATVMLIASTGPATAAVPDVVGDTLSLAQTTLAQAGFRTTTSMQSSPKVPSGSVISTTPGGGSQAATGSSVEILVSSGPALVTVPDVTGQSFKVALATLRAAGFAPTVSGQASKTVPLNDVITTTPAPNSQAAPGSVVDVIVSH